MPRIVIKSTARTHYALLNLLHSILPPGSVEASEGEDDDPGPSDPPGDPPDEPCEAVFYPPDPDPDPGDPQPPVACEWDAPLCPGNTVDPCGCLEDLMGPMPPEEPGGPEGDPPTCPPFNSSIRAALAELNSLARYDVGSAIQESLGLEDLE